MNKEWQLLHVTAGPDASASASTANNNGSNGSVVRGRVRGDRKPDTFNKLWSADEQRRLEDLLIKFPPEEVEMRRFGKIAQGFGKPHSSAGKPAANFLQVLLR